MRPESSGLLFSVLRRSIQGLTIVDGNERSSCQSFQNPSASVVHLNGKGGPNERERVPRNPTPSVTIITSASRRTLLHDITSRALHVLPELESEVLFLLSDSWFGP